MTVHWSLDMIQNNGVFLSVIETCMAVHWRSEPASRVEMAKVLVVMCSSHFLYGYSSPQIYVS